jgi:hypothetical protein
MRQASCRPPNRPDAMPLPAPFARRGGTKSRSNQRLLHHALTESLYRSVEATIGSTFQWLLCSQFAQDVCERLRRTSGGRMNIPRWALAGALGSCFLSCPQGVPAQTASPQPASACGASQIELYDGGGEGATGHFLEVYELRNKSRTPCDLTGITRRRLNSAFRTPARPRSSAREKPLPVFGAIASLTQVRP